MELSQQEKKLIISTLSTLRLNTYNDLVNNIKNVKKKISSKAFNLMVHGATPDNTNDKYYKISLLEGRWALKSIIHYHHNYIKNINKEQFNEINILMSVV